MMNANKGEREAKGRAPALGMSPTLMTARLVLTALDKPPVAIRVEDEDATTG